VTLAAPPRPPLRVVAAPPAAPDAASARTRSRGGEGLAVLVVFTALFGALGAWVVCRLHVVDARSLALLAHSLMVWHNDPPRLAALGVGVPPLHTVSLLPFTVSRGGATSLIALPLSAALFGGLAMAAVDRVFARCDIQRGRFVLVALVALNPVVAFAATAGGGAIAGAALIVAGLGALVAWLVGRDARLLMSGGAAFGLACVTDYALIAWLLLAAVAIGVTLRRHGAREREVEGSLILYLAPGAFLLGPWAAVAALTTQRPLGRLTGGPHADAVPASVGELLLGTGRLVAAGSPLAFAVLPALLWRAHSRRDATAGWLAAFLALAVATPLGEAIVAEDAGRLALHRALPVLVVTVIGLGWLHREAEGHRRLAVTLLAAGLLLSVPIGWRALDRYPHQGVEQAFRRAVLTGRDQEGTQARGGFAVGVGPERALADVLRAHPGRVLTDDAQTYAVIALTGQPSRFVDRADGGDARWRQAARHPPPEVRAFLFAKGDELSALRPRTAGGQTRRFTTVFETARYRLVAARSGLGR
jgi:hypothetical protein